MPHKYPSRLSTAVRDGDGFTLMEVVVTVAVVLILSIVSVVSYQGVQDRAKTSAVESAADEVFNAIQASRVSGLDDDIHEAVAEYTATSGDPITVQAHEDNDGFTVLALGWDGKYKATRSTLATPHNIERIPVEKDVNLPRRGYGVWQSIAYGNGKLVAVGDLNTVYTSDDLGATWNTAYLTGESTTASWDQVEFHDGKFVAVNGFNYAVSSDGEVWEVGIMPHSKSTMSDHQQALAYGNGVWVKANSYTTHVSSDGINWEEYDYIPEDSSKEINGIVYHDGVFMSFGSYGVAGHHPHVAFSKDGKTWSDMVEISIPDTLQDTGTTISHFSLKSAHVVDGKYVIPGYVGRAQKRAEPIFLVSENGKDWTMHYDEETGHGTRYVYTAGNQLLHFYNANQDGPTTPQNNTTPQNRYRISTNGTTWTPSQETPERTRFKDAVMVNGDIYVISGKDLESAGLTVIPE